MDSPGPVCVGDSITVELRAVRPARQEGGRTVYGNPISYVLAATHNGYTRVWTFRATASDLARAQEEAHAMFRRLSSSAESGTMVVDL